MSQPDQSASHILYNGPSFHVTGVQVVGDGDEVSLYFTATRHAFNPNATQVRPVNEVVARISMSPSGAKKVAEVLATYLVQTEQAKS